MPWAHGLLALGTTSPWPSPVGLCPLSWLLASSTFAKGGEGQTWIRCSLPSPMLHFAFPPLTCWSSQTGAVPWEGSFLSPAQVLGPISRQHDEVLRTLPLDTVSVSPWLGPDTRLPSGPGESLAYAGTSPWPCIHLLVQHCLVPIVCFLGSWRA